jgi:glycogen synthase
VATNTIVMLVTNAGLNDPRVLRSIATARHAGFTINLVCRALSAEKENVPYGTSVHRVPQLRLRWLLGKFDPRGNDETAGPDTPGGTTVYRISRVRNMSFLKWLFWGRGGGAFHREGFWLRSWEIWILGGMAWFNLQAIRKMWRLRGDLYHANDLDTLPAAVVLSWRHDAPLVYDAHELFASQFAGSSRLFQAILFSLEHWLIRFADRVVTVNVSIAETLAAWHRVPLPSVVMNCPLAVTTARPEPDGVGNSPARKARIIYQGVYVRDRGLAELIQSAAWYESAELYLRGYGDREPALRALVQAKGLEERVHFLPPAHHTQLVESLAGFDIGVVPYRPTTLNNRFCLPNKVFEYLQAGLALAVSALPELERLVKETETGELFDPERSEDIARAINALTVDRDRLAELQARARRAGQERYIWEVRGEPYLLACYQELIRSPLHTRRRLR